MESGGGKGKKKKKKKTRGQSIKCRSCLGLLRCCIDNLIVELTRRTSLYCVMLIIVYLHWRAFIVFLDAYIEDRNIEERATVTAVASLLILRVEAPQLVHNTQVVLWEN